MNGIKSGWTENYEISQYFFNFYFMEDEKDETYLFA